MNEPSRSHIVITGKHMYHVKPYEGGHLLIEIDGKLCVTGRDCQVKGIIVREEPNPDVS